MNSFISPVLSFFMLRAPLSLNGIDIVYVWVRDVKCVLQQVIADGCPFMD